MMSSLHNIYQNFLDTVASCSVPENQIFRVEVDCPETVPIQWLLQQKSLARYFWANRSRDYEMAGIGESDVILPNSQQRIADAMKQIAEKITGSKSRLRYYGGCRFHVDSGKNDLWSSFKSYRFALPLLELCNEGGHYSLACNINGSSDRDMVLKTLRSVTFSCSSTTPVLPDFFDRQDLPDFSGWEDMVNEALAAIAAKELQKVVLARQSLFHSRAKVDPVALVHLLAAVTKNVYLFCFEPIPDRAFLGASPELLYKRNKNLVASEALAGTRPRGKTSAEDNQYRKELLHSDKENREHQIVAKEVCAALLKFCSHVDSASEPQIMKLENCQHLHTSVTGLLNENSSDADLLEALHPTPAVGGFPKEKAMSWIEQKEPFERGIYASPVGWMGLGESEFCVGIRSGLVINDTLTLYSGAGIVAGSNPKEEWRELNAKLACFLKIIKKEL